MASSSGRQRLLVPDMSELEAQRVACSYLVKGCERALFDFGLIAGETPNVEAAAVDQRAVDIMRDVLGSWRDTLSLLVEGSPARTADRTSDGWVVMRQAAPRDSALEARLQ